MSSSPCVSVIMVFHRETPFLRPAIQSVFAQSFNDWELILVDNGFGLPESALGEIGQDPRIVWVRLPENRGIPGGHNAGVKVARGEFIALLDYDDIMLPLRLEKQVAALKAQPEVGMMSSLARRIDENDTVIGKEFSLLDADEQFAFTAFAAPVVTPAYSGRREVFLRWPYREFLPWAADLDFLARAAEVVKFSAVPEILFHYRWHEGQTTQQKRAAIEQNLVAIRLMTARRRCGRTEQTEQIQAWLGQPAPPAVQSDYWGARTALKENLWELSAYLCRKMVAANQSPFWLARASATALRTLLLAPGDAKRRAAKLLFCGPVKALGLRPTYEKIP